MKGNLLQIERRGVDITSDELAAHLGVTPQAIRRLEGRPLESLRPATVARYRQGVAELVAARDRGRRLVALVAQAAVREAVGA